LIDEKKTLELFGYRIKNLPHSSTKKVLRICDACKEERLVEYRKHTNLCHACSCKTKEYKLKQSKNSSGKNNGMYNKHHTKETKLKMSKSKENMYNGNKNPMYGKHHTEETKRKQSESLLGEKSPCWKGGRKLSKAKTEAKRRKLFGFISHNKPQKDFHGHHIDFNHVIFIPKELHMSISHSVTNDINMDLINDAVCDWYLKFQIIN
jgi:hypothetical protein